MYRVSWRYLVNTAQSFDTLYSAESWYELYYMRSLDIVAFREFYLNLLS